MTTNEQVLLWMLAFQVGLTGVFAGVAEYYRRKWMAAITRRKSRTPPPTPTVS